ncbi:MAG TPA: hypothetical protein VMS86_02695 [Thermoanaerobaculia bacterium]|nr:hypothetical protein [Thermoanaerobaculia bacterium]
MSTDRFGARRLAAALVALAITPALAAQEPVEPIPDDGLGRVPGSEPTEPPDPLEGGGRTAGREPLDELDEAVEPGLGSFFQTSFAVAGAHDRISGTETVTIEGEPPPADPNAPPGPPTIESRDFAIAETGWVVRPSFLFVHRPSARGSVVVAYEPELEQLDRGDRPDRVSHSAGVVAERRTSRRTDLTAGASYLDSFDPSRHLGGDSFVLIPGRFEQQRLYGGLSHRWRRATRLHLYTGYSSAKSDLDPDGIPLDVSDLSGTLALEQGIGRRSNVILSYTYTDTELESVGADVPAPTRFSGPVEALRVGFAHRASRRVSFHLATGVLRDEDEETGAQGTSWIGSGELARESEVLELRLRYDRSLFALGRGDVAVSTGLGAPVLPGTVLGDTVADTISFHLRLEPPGRLRWEQSIWLARRTLIESDDVDTLMTSSLVEVLLTGGNAARVGLFARLDYSERDDSDLFGAALSRERFSLGLRVGLSGPQTKAAQRLALDEMSKVLPNGGRL